MHVQVLVFLFVIHHAQSENAPRNRLVTGGKVTTPLTREKPVPVPVDATLLIVNTGVILSSKPTNSDEFHTLWAIFPAVKQAIKDAKEIYRVDFNLVQPNIKIYDQCEKKVFGGVSVDMTEVPLKHAMYLVNDKLLQSDRSPNLLKSGGLMIAPACTPDTLQALTVAEGYLAVAVTGAGELIDSIAQYSNALRCGMNTYTLWRTFVDFSALYGWKRFGLIYDTTVATLSTYASSLIVFIANKKLAAQGYQIVPFTINGKSDQLNPGDTLNQINRFARIIVLLVNPKTVRRFMIAAVEKEMTKGEHIFFTVDIFHKEILHPDDYSSPGPSGWKQDDANDTIARKAYQSLFVIALKAKRSLPEWKKLERDIQSLIGIDDDLIYVNSQNTGQYHSELTYYAAAYYDCIMFQALQYRAHYGWVDARHRIYSNDPAVGAAPGEGNLDAKDIANLTSMRRGKVVYQGASGDMYIMENGDRDEDFDVISLTNPDAGTYGVVASYTGHTGVVTLSASQAIVWPRVNNTAPPSTPVCGFQGCDPGLDVVMLSCAVGIPLTFILAIVFYFWRKSYLTQQALNEAWVAHPVDLKVQSADKEKEKEMKKLAAMAAGKTKDTDQVSGASMGASMGNSMKSMGESMGGAKVSATAFWKSLPVTQRYSKKTFVRRSRALTKQVQTILKLEHENLLGFLGGCLEKEHCMILYEFANKGSLFRVLGSENFKLDWTVRFSFLNDCMKGLHYIHGSPLKTHGRLTSLCCFIDAGFLLRIADYGLHAFYDLNVSELWAARRDPDYRLGQMWKAPEHLLTESQSQTEVKFPSSTAGDVYSWGIIAQEILLRSPPFSMFPGQEPGEIIERVKRSTEKGAPPFQPILDDVTICIPELRDIVKLCYEVVPSKRPTLVNVRKVMREQGKALGMTDHSNVLDTLLLQMEEQSARLQAIVDEKGRDLLDEKLRSDTLLYKILPNEIAETLKKGSRPSPASFELVTVAFVDLLGFTNIASESTPLQVIDFLNDLYAFFDDNIQRFDAYKIESANDVTLVVSGCPTPNGILHAREIGRLALTILFKINNFKIRHRPDDQINLRTGIHSGPLVAGVVGKMIPHFCLFGATISICSRMLTSGEALKIQLSSMTKNILDTFGSFRMSERGEIFVKGRGAMKTYWLIGEDGNLELLELQRKFEEEDIDQDYSDLPNNSSSLNSSLPADPISALGSLKCA